MSVQKAVAKGNREALIALRDRLAEEIDCCTDHKDLASLARQFREVINALGDEINSESTLEGLRKKLNV